MAFLVGARVLVAHRLDERLWVQAGERAAATHSLCSR
jgi:hypothetical protein